MASVGHEGRLPPAKLNGRYRFRKRSAAVSDCRPGLLGQALSNGAIASAAVTKPLSCAASHYLKRSSRYS